MKTINYTKKKNRMMNFLIICALLSMSTIILEYAYGIWSPMLLGFLIMVVSYALVVPKIIQINKVTTIASILASIPLLNGIDLELLKDALHKWLDRDRSQRSNAEVSLMEFYLFTQGKEEYISVCDKLETLLLQIKIIDFKDMPAGTTVKPADFR